MGKASGELAGARDNAISAAGQVHPVRSMVIYVGAVFLLGGLLAPWFYWLGQWLGGRIPSLHALSEAPFHRYLHRSLLLVAVLGLWPFLKSIEANSWNSVGMQRKRGSGRRLLLGFVLGFVACAVIGGVALLTESRRWDRAHELWAKLPTIVFSAVLVALLEELLFRGALFGALLRVHKAWPAVLISSAFFAAVHFLQGTKAHGEITWFTGLEQLGRMASRFAMTELLIPGIFSLTLLGMTLALAYYRTGNLYFSLGLHGGLVFWLKAFNALTVPGPEARGVFGISKNAYDGWLGFAMAVLAFIVVCGFLNRKESNAPARA